MTGVAHPRPFGRDSGLSLLELVVVLAIFSMVAIMGLGALRGALRTQDGLTRVETHTAALARALTLLRADLEAMVPLPFTPPEGAPEPAFRDLRDAGSLTFSIGGQATLPGQQLAGLSRVIWRFDPAKGRLTRQIWPVLRPADASVEAPEVTMLDNVRDLEVRANLPKSGWITGYGQNGDADLPLPLAVEVKITSIPDGPLRVLVVR